ncbi:BREX-1 system adenine-specific DNA-methyltransferase PglX [Levilactobacillus namurensis]|uniref:site-specific DNA-methyltransferase (adenine-specific) n=1 Tax=Levilactobacillus namurensis TaxID=380393 RepID=A0AAW8W3N1_9LACO|nr:BREX-1 system adenine-specific DNA-methyltransferase PglX [Levilactobacillus namurensis]MDT7013342.1 BREX-1 system adenine-specific DNA-methyltransferase PglX [Levilactobacillus namurensis]
MRTTHDFELFCSFTPSYNDGVIRHLIEDVDEADFDVTQGGQVEIIGWLYQYYNTEPKDRAFKKRKYEETDIPAVTQLFTPDWIVKYMVENSLGHYWIRVLQARGDMRSEKEVATSMGWQYLMPTAPQTPAVTLAVNADQRELANVRPEDITLIDAAMGSGHILIYAFEVLMIIYGQEGYSRREAAKLIVEKNLWGLDIDTRAFQLAYFALMMKGRQYHRRFLELNIRPNVFDVPDSQGLSVDDFQAVLYNQQERTAVSDILTLFKYGNEYGSLIMPPDTLDWEALQDIANRQPQLGQLSLGTIALADKQQRLKELIATGEVLAHQYTLGVMNPPYMGSGKMDAILAKYVKKHFPNSKADLFGVFMERLQDLVQPNGYFAMITQHAWMFLSSFEKLRQALRQTTLLNMAHLGTRAFEEIGGEVVQSTTFVFKKQTVPTFVGNYERLVAFDSQSKKEQAYLAAVQNPEIDYLYRTNQANFTKIPGMPIAYWASENLLHDFEVGTRMDELAAPHVGLQTGNNTLFLRQWFEVQHSRINFQASSLKDAEQSGKKWFPYNKGGSYRKWYGNYDYVVNWEDNGYEIRHFTDSKGKVRSRPQNTDYYFHEAITWSLITSGNFSMRYREHGSIHDVSGMSVFSTNSNNLKIILGIMNSPVGNYIFKIVNPTINLQIGNVTSFPVMIDKVNDSPLPIIDRCIYMEKEDWNSREISWNFGTSPLLTHIADEQLAHCRSPIGV